MLCARHTVMLLALGAMAPLGVTYDIVWGDDTVVTYQVVTSDPPCTALRMERMEAVTKLTPLRDGYGLSEIGPGVPILIEVPEDLASDTAQSLLGQPKVISVSRVGPAPNGSDAGPWPGKVGAGMIYPGGVLGNCYPAVDQEIEKTLRAAIIHRDLNGGGASGAGTGPVGNDGLVPVSIIVHNITSMVAYLEENDIRVMITGSTEYNGNIIRAVEAMIPPCFAIPLSERDDFSRMFRVSPIVQNVGAQAGAGVAAHEADAWNKTGYDGTGISVGVIDKGFGGLDATCNLVPHIPFLCFNFTGHASETDAGFCRGDTKHGTAVVKTLMDAAPGAKVYVSGVHTSGQLGQAVEWMQGKGVDVITASTTMLLDGPGGANSTGAPALDIVEWAAENGIFWVGAAGDYENGRSWSAGDPLTYNKLVVFDPTTNDMTNRFEARAGEPVYVLLRWHDADSSNTDLNLIVSNGTHHHTGVTDQWRGGPTLPIESVAFVPPSDGHYDIVIAAIGPEIPDRVHLLVGGTDDQLEHTNGTTTPVAAHWGEQNRTPASLIVTTHNPACTTVFLSGYNVTRPADLRENRMYPTGDLGNGIDMTFGIHEDEAFDLVSLLMKRPAVSHAVSYSTGVLPVLLAQGANHDIYPTDGLVPCEISESILRDAMFRLRTIDSSPADSLSQHFVQVGIHTNNLADTLAYLEENGARIVLVDGGGPEASFDAFVPVSLLIPLSNEEHVTRMVDRLPHYFQNLD